MAMQAYLQHLREHMNDHEDKVAMLSAEQSEQETHIRYLQKDLESVAARADINRVEGEVEVLSKENDNMSKLIISRQNELETLEADSRTLSQASELMNESLHKKSSHTLEAKSSYEKLQADARSHLDQLQAQFESLRRPSEVTDASLTEAADKAPVTASQPSLDENDHGEITGGDVEMVEPGNDMVGARLRLEQLQEETKRAGEDLIKTNAENSQFEAGFGALEESLRELNEEKLAEEDFMQTLHNRLQQLKDYCQDVVCGSCKHAYVIEWEGSKFVIRSA